MPEFPCVSDVRRMGLCLLPVVLLAGCGWLGGEKGLFRDRAGEYSKAAELPPLAIPDDLDRQRIQAFYVIPPAASTAASQGPFEVPRPEALAQGRDDQAVRIQKLGDEQWALVSLAPDQAWPVLKGFLQSNRVALQAEHPQQGLIITDWLQAEGRVQQEQYVIRLDAGVQRNSTEVHVRQRQQGSAAELPWPRRSDVPAREQALLYEIAGHFAASTSAVSVSLLAQGIRTASKVNLQQASPGAEPWLLLELPYDRAWASLGVALDKAGFTLLDQNHSDGVYYVARPAAAEQPGWWARRMGAKRAATPAVGERGAWRVSLRPLDAQRMRIGIDGHAPGTLAVAEQVRYLNLIKGYIN